MGATVAAIHWGSMFQSARSRFGVKMLMRYRVTPRRKLFSGAKSADPLKRPGGFVFRLGMNTLANLRAAGKHASIKIISLLVGGCVLALSLHAESPLAAGPLRVSANHRH